MIEESRCTFKALWQDRIKVYISSTASLIQRLRNIFGLSSVITPFLDLWVCTDHPDFLVPVLLGKRKSVCLFFLWLGTSWPDIAANCNFLGVLCRERAVGCVLMCFELPFFKGC